MGLGRVGVAWRWAPACLQAALVAAGVFVLLVIWVRPAPMTLYGMDAGCYARVAATVASSPVSRWVDVRLEDEPFYEHPPGFVFFEAMAFRAAGASAATAVMLARLFSTLTAAAVVMLAYRVSGARAALGALLALPALSSFLFESQNPMLEMPLCAALLVAMLGAWELAERPALGGALFVIGSAVAFWVKGPPAMAAGVYLVWAGWRRRAPWARVAAAGAAALLVLGGSIAWFESARSLRGLPSFFATYWQHQVYPSLLHGRHNPIASPWYYLPVIWRWQTVGVVLAVPALVTVWRRRRSVPAAAVLAEMGVVWGAVLFVGFSAARQKYQWYLHPMVPCFAWLAGALAAAWPLAPWRPGYRRAGVGALVSLTAAYGMVLLLRPELMYKHNRKLEALHAAAPPVFAPGEEHAVAYCDELGWREDHLARFLWRSDLVACDVAAPYRFNGLTLRRVVP